MQLNLLLVLWLGLSNPLFLLGAFKSLVIHEKYDEALLVSKRIDPKFLPTEKRHLFYTYQASAYHQLGMKKETQEAIKKYNDQFGYASEREKAIVFLIEDDLKGWTKNKIDSPARKMKVVASRLKNDLGGPITQKWQKEIIDDLDRIIKQEEEDQKNAMKVKGQGGDGGDSDNPEGQSPKGQKDSKGGTDSGPGKVDNIKLTKLGQNWGVMPPKERAKAMQEITRDLPSKHRELIEQYFKRLAATGDGK